MSKNINLQGQEGGDIPPSAAHKQVADPAVSKIKFDRELEIFNSGIDTQRKRGILLFRASFPEMILAFAAPQLHPAPIVFGVKLDFTNYDASPPSLTFINPFTEEPSTYEETLVKFARNITPAGSNRFIAQPLLMPRRNFPFLCVPGIREYHEHPAHTGDSWLLHRTTGEGRLGFLIDQLHLYGISSLTSYWVHMQFSAPFQADLQIPVKVMFLQDQHLIAR